jgi:hypothetical protein
MTTILKDNLSPTDCSVADCKGAREASRRMGRREVRLERRRQEKYRSGMLKRMSGGTAGS